MFDPMFLVAGGCFLASASVTTTPELLISTGAILVAVTASHVRQGGRLKNVESAIERIEKKGACAHPNCPVGGFQQKEAQHDR